MDIGFTTSGMGKSLMLLLETMGELGYGSLTL
jgi:hypothetical protein